MAKIERIKEEVITVNDLKNIITDKQEKKHWDAFEKGASYTGNGTYEWRGHRSADTRELFLMGIASAEGIYFEEEEFDYLEEE